MEKKKNAFIASSSSSSSFISAYLTRATIGGEPFLDLGAWRASSGVGVGWGGGWIGVIEALKRCFRMPRRRRRTRRRKEKARGVVQYLESGAP